MHNEERTQTRDLLWSVLCFPIECVLRRLRNPPSTMKGGLCECWGVGLLAVQLQWELSKMHAVFEKFSKTPWLLQP